MLFFNALTKLQAGLFGLLASVAAPEQPVEFDEDASIEDLNVSGFDEFTDEVDPSENRRWECWDWGDYKRRGYCLARCEDSYRYVPVTDRIRVRGNRDYCERRARRYCKRRGDRVDDYCFGERDRDDDDDDDGGHRD